MQKIQINSILMLSVICSILINCHKKPISTNEHVNNSVRLSKKKFMVKNEYTSRIVNDPTRQDPNPDMDKPNQPGCIPGNQSCYEIVITPNDNPSEIWRIGIDQGNLPYVMTTNDIEIVSDNDHYLYNVLMDVKNGVYEMSYLHFERGTGFFINESNPGINNCFCSFVIYNE